MPHTISSDGIVEKNKLNNSGAWLIMMQIIYKTGEPIYVTSNNATTTWNSLTWYPVPFELGDIEETKEGSVPSTSLRIHDLERRITPYLDTYGGGVGAQVTIYVVHSDHLANTTAEIEEIFSLLSVKIDSNNVITIDLGAENLFNYRTPQDRYLKNHCRFINPWWDGFKGDYCKYAGAETECDGTFTRCRELENTLNFGAFPSVGRTGIYG